MQFTARPTTYRGIQMRSRLEATFAAALDETGLAWTYEPRAYAGRTGQYLPDFEVRLANGRPLFIEVKPTVELAFKWMPRMLVIRESVPDVDLMIAAASGPYWLSKPALHEGRWIVGLMDWSA